MEVNLINKMITISDAIAASLNAAKTSRAINTARSYQSGMRIFVKYLEDMGIGLASPLPLLDVSHFIGYSAWLLDRVYARGTTKVYLAASRYFYEWLVIAGHISPSYTDTLRIKAAGSRITRRSEAKLPRVPRQELVDHMLLAAREITTRSPIRERDIAVVELLATSGCRSAEICSLLIRDISLVDRTAIVIGKGAKERVVFFGTGAAKALDTYWTAREFRDANSPVFCRHDRGAGKKHKPISTRTVRNIMKRISSWAGIEPGAFSAHRFRHAFATKMLRETRDLALVQELLGHESPTTTRIYAKVDPLDIKNAHRSIFD